MRHWRLKGFIMARGHLSKIQSFFCQDGGLRIRDEDQP